MGKKTASKKEAQSANLGFETKLWLAADKLRNNMDAAEYKHTVLGLIFLKYISDAFEELHAALIAGEGQYAGADPEDADEYRAENVFWVPPEARWKHLQDNAKQPNIGKLIDDAMDAIERDNPKLKGTLTKDYARPALDKQRLGELIDLIGTIGLGDKENRSKDILGRVYEYFLSEFASAEGKKGGQFYTPSCVVRVLVEMLAPYKGRVYDPCCGSGGMFVQSEKFVEVHGGRIGDIAIYGQESNPTTRRLAMMNLAIRGIDGDIGKEHADTFRRDLHKDLKADYVIANPPFNDSDWNRVEDDVRWKYGVPPRGNANFAWVQHFIHHVAPNGFAGFVLANGSMSSNQSGEGDIRKAMIEDDLVDCMVALPGQLFYSTQIPVCLWFLTRSKQGSPRAASNKASAHHLDSPRPASNKASAQQLDSPRAASNKSSAQQLDSPRPASNKASAHHLDSPRAASNKASAHHLDSPRPASGRGVGGEGNAQRDRHGETLFLDARKMGSMIDRVHRELTTEDIQRLADTYHAWRGDLKKTSYEDIPGFCKSATKAEIAAHGYVLTPGRYVGAEEVEDDGDPFEEKMPRLVAELHAQFAESAKLEQAIKANLRGLGYGE